MRRIVFPARQRYNPAVNFLAHLHLAGDDPHMRVGCVLADFVRGRRPELEERFPMGVVDGIEHHRIVDRFMDSHPCVRESRALLHPAYGHRSRVIVDVLFDYYLGKHWLDMADGPFDGFVHSCYEALQQEMPGVPGKFRRFVEAVLDYDLLHLYATWDGMEETFHRLNHRFSQPLPVQSLMADLGRWEGELSSCFLTFYPEAVEAVGGRVSYAGS